MAWCGAIWQYDCTALKRIHAPPKQGGNLRAWGRVCRCSRILLGRWRTPGSAVPPPAGFCASGRCTSPPQFPDHSCLAQAYKQIRYGTQDALSRDAGT